MEIFDVSVPLREGMVTYPGDPEVHLESAASIAGGDVVNLTRIDFGLHSGTHVDAPVHFIEGGDGIDSLDLGMLTGTCLVVAADPPGRELRPQDLPATEHQRILFKTRNSERWARGDTRFDTEFVAVGLELAQRLIETGKRLVGVDYLSVESYHAAPEHPVHKALLAARVAVIEGLDLSKVEPGEYELYCLPLKLVGSDGAPARTILVGT